MHNGEKCQATKRYIFTMITSKNKVWLYGYMECKNLNLYSTECVTDLDQQSELLIF